jgi:hypothetical protein
LRQAQNIFIGQLNAGAQMIRERDEKIQSLESQIASVELAQDVALVSEQKKEAERLAMIQNL